MNPYSERTHRLLTFLVAGTFFMENLDGTVITTAVPTMAKSFGVAAADLSTGVSAYVITLGVFIPVSGWIADRFGTRKVFAFAITLFTLASLLCAAATGLSSFVAARVLQGIGGAMMVPVGRLVILRITPKERLITALTTLTWPGLVAPVLGPPVGGFITQHFSWPWIFFLNLPLGALALTLALRLVPEVHAESVKPFDTAGFVLLGASVTSLTFGIESTARAEIIWTRVAIALIAGAVLFAIALRHLRRTETPVIDLSALRVPTFAVTIAGGTVFRAAINATPFLLPLMFQLGFGMDAFHSGLMMMAIFGGNLSMKAITTPILRRFGFRTVLVGNGLLNVAALLVCAVISPATPVAVMAILLFLGGGTRSLQFTALSTIAFVDIPKAQTSAANSLFATVMQLSMGLGITLGAVALRVGRMTTGWLADGNNVIAQYHTAFVLIAIVSVVGVVDVWRLHSDAGAHVSRLAA